MPVADRYGSIHDQTPCYTSDANRSTILRSRGDYSHAYSRHLARRNEAVILSHSSPDRPRVSAAVLRADGREVLMVQHHRPDGATYWQFPGGGIEADEHPETAVLRELAEETGLLGRIVQHLFVIPYKYGHSTTYLVVVDDDASLHLGTDPEERDAAHQKLTDVAWQPLNAMRNNPEIEALKHVLTKLQPGLVIKEHT